MNVIVLDHPNGTRVVVHDALVVVVGDGAKMADFEISHARVREPAVPLLEVAPAFDAVALPPVAAPATPTIPPVE